ncbi:MAG: hypothetical protein K0S93_1473, partial [Nitrososphaeraceae archaeon]|nr:hypothetical protein [Nitrososphaeraceae archaeon]
YKYRNLKYAKEGVIPIEMQNRNLLEYTTIILDLDFITRNLF